MTPLQFNSFRDRLEAASGFQSVQFRELEAVLGRRDKSMVDHLEPNSEPQQRVQSAMNRPALFDSVISYLTKRGHKMPVAVTARDFSEQYEANEEVQESLANTYRNDPEAAMMLERLIDIDEGLQEWRYRHVKMVERTIGMKHGTGGSSGAAYLASTLFKPTFPDLWAVRLRF
jgi:tryptophan 2,3-dioxygenase